MAGDNNLFTNLGLLFDDDDDQDQTTASNLFDNDLLTTQFQSLLEEDAVIDEARQPKFQIGTGNPIYDFLGQGLWGGISELTLGGTEVRDVVGKEFQGDDYFSWQQVATSITPGGGYDADWSDLSNWGKAGQTIGRGFGMIPYFATGAKLVQPLIKNRVTKWLTGNLGKKTLLSKSANELKEAGVNLGIKKGDEVIQGLNISSKAARDIIEEGFDLQEAAKHALKQVDDATEGFYKSSMADDLSLKISEVLEVGDDISKQLANATTDILTKYDPNNSMNLIQATIQGMNIPLLRGEGTSRVLAAMGYDAAIGLVMGTQRAIASEVFKNVYGVERSHITGEYEYTDGDHSFDGIEFAGHWWDEASTSAWHFSFIGPVKFFNPFKSTSASQGKRLREIIGHWGRSWRPLQKMNNERLRANITAVDAISGGYLNNTFTREVTRKSKLAIPANNKWWETKKLDSDNKLLREYLSDLRHHFIRKAPLAWTKEFLSDTFRSLPRMAAGVVAMHAPGYLQTMKHYGHGSEAAINALGQTPEERIANIWMAMWFTRRPHSFRTEATRPMFNKLFETGTIDNYIKGKNSQLRQIMGSIRTFNSSDKALNNLFFKYGTFDSNSREYDGKLGEVIEKYLDGTFEFKEIEKLFNRFPNAKSQIGGFDLESAYQKRIYDMVEKGDIAIDDVKVYTENMHIVREVLKMYSENSGKNLIADTYLPEQAFEIVNGIAQMKFNGRILTSANVTPELKDYIQASISKATLPPIQIQKQFIIDAYKALDIAIEIDPKTGVLKIPSLSGKINFAGNREVLTSFETIIEEARVNGWIKFNNVSVDPASLHYKPEVFKDIADMWKKSSDNLMTSVHGDGWEGNVEFDPLILSDPSWGRSYNKFLQLRRNINTYEILRGSSNHSIDPNDATAVMAAIDTFMKFKNTPKVLETNEAGKLINQDTYGEVVAFIERLHKGVKLMNPTITQEKASPLTFREAQNLMNLVSGEKGKIGRGILGDMYTNAE